MNPDSNTRRRAHHSFVDCVAACSISFSYADVSEAIDIRKASIHHHFPTKQDLVIAVLNAWREAFDSDMALLDASGADALAQLRAYIAHWERCISDDSAPFCVAGMLGAELPSLPDEVAKEVRGFFDNLTAWIQRTLDSGVKDNVLVLSSPVETEAATIVSLVYGAMLAARASGNVPIFKRVTESGIERIVKPRKRSRSS